MAKVQSKAGFTMVEMIVVLSVITILVAALVPTLSRSLPGIRLSGSSRNLVGDLRAMQEKAITEQNQHLIRFFPAAAPPNYQLIRIYNSTEEIQRTVQLSNDESISLAATITANQIVFSPDGGPSSSGDITLAVGTSQKIINVSPAGYIKIR